MVRTIAVALALLAPVPASAQTLALQPGETLLEVQAEGTATVRPDTAYVTAGVVSTGTTAAEATQANAQTMTAVIAAVRAAGVDERYVRTRQISVQPRFARAANGGWDEQARITGYVANNSVTVTVTRLDRASPVIGAAFAAGANSVNGPDLSLMNEGPALAEARSDAITSARAQADAYAAALGMRVARVIRVSERGQRQEPVAEIMVTGSRVQSAGAMAPPPPPPPPVAGGEIRQRATVWIDFALVSR